MPLDARRNLVESSLMAANCSAPSDDEEIEFNDVNSFNVNLSVSQNGSALSKLIQEQVRLLKKRKDDEYAESLQALLDSYHL